MNNTLDRTTLDRSVRVLGSPNSLDALFQRLAAGRPITMGVVGASVAQNAGCLDQDRKRCMFFSGINGRSKGWAVRLLEHINKSFPHARHAINNSALDATPVNTYANCLFSHLPSQVHLVVAEWGSMGNHNHKFLPSIERVTQTLLQLPSKPVVLHFGVHEWCTQKISPREFYRTGDELFGRTTNGFIYPDTPWARVELESTRVCQHYSQPCISMKEALEPHVLNALPGFSLRDLTGDDCLHPANGRHGVEYASQMLAHWFDHAHDIWRSATSKRRLRPWQVPEALHAENRAASTPTRCYTFKWADSGDMMWGRKQGMHPLAWCSPPPSIGSKDIDDEGGRCTPGFLAHKTERLICGGGKILPDGAARHSDGKAVSDAEYRVFMASPPASWFWCPVSLSPIRRKPSEGVVAVTPGAVLLLSVDAFLLETTNGADQTPLGLKAVGVKMMGARAKVEEEKAKAAGVKMVGARARLEEEKTRARGRISETDVTLLLEHLISYEGMGRVRVHCLAGCSCKAQTIDAHRLDETRNTSVFVQTPLAVRATAGRRCELRLILQRGSSSGAHKFKLRGLRVVAGLNVSASFL